MEFQIIDNLYFDLISDSVFPLSIPEKGWQKLSEKSFVNLFSNPSIYLIKVKNYLYVGSDTYNTRIYRHKSCLKLKKHPNDKIQNLFNKYGVENLFYLPLVEIPNEYLNFKKEIENSYIKLFNSFAGNNKLGLNLCEFSESGASYRIQKEFEVINPDGETVKAKGLLKFCKDRGLNPGCLCSVLQGKTFNHNGWRKFDEKLVGVPFDKSKFLEEVRENQPHLIGKLINPKGEVVTYNNLAKFAKQNNLTKTGIHGVVNNKNSHCKGFRKFSEDLIGVPFTGIIYDRSIPSYHLVSPDGKEFIGENLKDFCRDNNLSYRQIATLVRNRSRGSFKGWGIL